MQPATNKQVKLTFLNRNATQCRPAFLSRLALFSRLATCSSMFTLGGWLIVLGAVMTASAMAEERQQRPATIYTYSLSQTASADSYDESVAVACFQGLINRHSPQIYVRSPRDKRPDYWKRILSQPDRWLNGVRFQPLANLDELVEMARPHVKGAVIWDPAVPATLNVATTIAGAKDAVVVSPEYAERFLPGWKFEILDDLRGRFTGSETGSSKNDAYRWAIREYLQKGTCSKEFLCLYEDAFSTRQRGDVGYVVTRDWAVRNRAFVYDLSPWGDEVPADDRQQTLGTDLATYRMMLDSQLQQTAPKVMTEVAGFFAFAKYSNVPGHASAHDPVPTEWETVWLISPYNCYQNTVASSCFNQSLHSHAPWKRLHQRKPGTTPQMQNKAYIAILMADYDSATPLYDFMPKHWDDPRRGEIPLAWGINPNLIESYPDIISHLYATATSNDFFTADASAAGYMNPNRVQQQFLPLFVKHNQHYFHQTDMTIAPMVLDWDQPSAAVKDTFTQFAPDGLATIVMDLHQNGGRGPQPHVWKGMPVTNLINNTCNFSSPEQTAAAMYASLQHKQPNEPGFFFYRIVWTSPGQVIRSLEVLGETHPEIDFEVVDPYTFFRLFKTHYQE